MDTVMADCSFKIDREKNYMDFLEPVYLHWENRLLSMTLCRKYILGQWYKVLKGNQIAEADIKETRETNL